MQGYDGNENDKNNKQLAPWNRVKKLPVVCETERFITMFTTGRLSLSWADEYSPHSSILFKVKCNVFFISKPGPSKTMPTLRFPRANHLRICLFPCTLHAPPNLFLLSLIISTLHGEYYTTRISTLCNFTPAKLRTNTLVIIKDNNNPQKEEEQSSLRLKHRVLVYKGAILCGWRALPSRNG